jgi:anti-sigma regulatory factor (Ser/Thr protein kinase)
MGNHIVSNSSQRHVLGVTNAPALKDKLSDLSCHDFDIVVCGGEGSDDELCELQSSTPISLVIIGPDFTPAEVYRQIDRYRTSFNDPEFPMIVICSEKNRKYEADFLANGIIQVVGETVAFSDIMKNSIYQIIKNIRQVDALEQTIAQHVKAIDAFETARFVFRTREQANDISALLSKNMPEPTLICMGLLELLLNAVEHGLYGLGAKYKNDLINAGKFEEEIKEKETSLIDEEMFVTIDLEKNATEYRFVITDTGQGFDYENTCVDHLNTFTCKNGRGIMMASHCFNTLSYSKGGRRVIATVKRETNTY